MSEKRRKNKDVNRKRNQPGLMRQPWIIGIALALLVAGGIFLWIYHSRPVVFSAQAGLSRVSSIYYQHPDNHIHGLGYDSQNQRLFVASHYGLFIWKDGELSQLGSSRDDFMGFSLHPSNPGIIYTSGHPKKGGNMGVMKSEDGAVTFKRIFRGLKAETVDFHSMVIGSGNSGILYGWFQGNLYRSKDGGRKWEFVVAKGLPAGGFCWGAPCLAAGGSGENSLYAGIPGGLMVSRDFGESWTARTTALGAVAGVGIDPANPRRLFAFTEKYGLAVSEDTGEKWQGMSNGITLSGREFIFGFAFDVKHPGHVFAATPERIFRTLNGGEKWEKIL